MVLPVGVLHPMDSIREEIFPGKLETSWELVNLLELAQGLIEGRLEGLSRPHQEPVVTDGLGLIW